MPAGSKSDNVRHCELGARSRWLGGDLLLDATLFYVDWSDIQLRLQTPDFVNDATNGGKARGRDAESAGQLPPVRCDCA